MTQAHLELDASHSFVQPRALRWIWGLLALLTAIEAVHEIFGLGVEHVLFDDWIHNVVSLAAGLLCIARAWYEPHGRQAWALIGAGLLAWSAGEVVYTLLYDGMSSPPYPTLSDPLWLAWYPLTALGIALLIRLRLSHFELHRWMDGVAVMLLVLVPAVALFLEPVLESTQGAFARIFEIAYPVLDALVLGAIIGVYSLLDWRPGRSWLLLGLGGILLAVGDALFAVQEARDAPIEDGYDVVWTVGALLIAYAAWSSLPAPPHHSRPTGWRAIALPLAAQAIAAAIQVYGLFVELGPSERIVTIAVLVIAMVQIIITRPRA
jgi:hypothetical protein